MKLFYKYNRINFFVTGIIFLLAAIAFYFLLNYVLVSQVDADLEIEQHEIETYVSKHNKLPEPATVEDQFIIYKPISASLLGQQYKTANLFDSVEKEESDFRELLFSIKANGQWYQATVAKSLEGTAAITHTVTVITCVTLLLILIVSLLANRLILRRLWQPFYTTITAIQNFNLGQNKKFEIVNSNIDEFGLLNKTLQQSINKAEVDYQLLKEFTENASHELQTPLAIIQSKLELLIQDEQLSENQSYAVQGANDAIQKLTRLNQSLLLLSKIENRQFAIVGPINLALLVQQKITVFKEMLHGKKLMLNKSLQEATITMNKDLADILLNNLLNNAIRHTQPGSEVLVSLKNNQLVIANTAASKGLNEEKLFYRFYKSEAASAGQGLGISIVKQIAEVSGFAISYRYAEGMHQFILDF